MLISLAIINFNCAASIERAIRSCQNQFRNTHEIEILVIDDKSTDDSLATLEQFGENIRLYKNLENKGAGFNSQFLLEKARGDFFMRVDADDYLSQFATGTLSLALTTHPYFDFAYGDLYLVNELGLKLEILDMSNKDNLIDHGAGILFRTEVLKEVGGYNETLRNGEDIDLMLRLMKNNHKGVHLPVAFYRYYRHNSNISKTGAHIEAKINLRKAYSNENRFTGFE